MSAHALVVQSYVSFCVCCFVVALGAIVEVRAGQLTDTFREAKLVCCACCVCVFLVGKNWLSCSH